MSLKKYLVLGLIFVLLYLLSRFWHLTAIPVFGDEAIYLRWSQIIKDVETLRFIPLTDGKQPLFMWLTVPFFKFIADPLVAGRILSILAGLVTAASLYFISGGLTAPLLYLCLPFTFFFDRLALPDNLLAMFGSLALLLSLRLARSPRLDLSLILGGILGLAWLTKSPAIYFIILSALTFFLFNLKNFKFFYFSFIFLFLAFAIYNLLRLGPQFHQIAARNRDYVWPLTEILRHPLDPLKPHLSDILTLYAHYIGPVFFFLFPVLYVIRNTKYVILLLWWLLPLLTTAVFAKVFTARYILFTLPPLIALLALGFSRLSFRFKNLFLLLFLIPNLIFIFRLSTNPFTLKLSSTETGYLTNWTSGWGIKPAADYLISRSYQANVIVGTEGYFGTLPDGLQVYANHVPRLTVIGVGLGFTQIPDNLVNAKNYGDEVYLLLNQSRLQLTPTETKKLTIVKEFPKPDNDKLVLFRL